MFSNFMYSSVFDLLQKSPLRFFPDFGHPQPRTTLCSEFKCKTGHWIEKKKDCPAECSIFGTQHVVTFDGLKYNFDSECEVVLLTNECSGKSPKKEDIFTLTAKNEPCENAPSLVCTKKLTLHHGINKDKFEIKGTSDSQGRRQIEQNGVKPVLGTRHIGLYYIIQVIFV